MEPIFDFFFNIIHSKISPILTDNQINQ